MYPGGLTQARRGFACDGGISDRINARVFDPCYLGSGSRSSRISRRHRGCRSGRVNCWRGDGFHRSRCRRGHCRRGRVSRNSSFFFLAASRQSDCKHRCQEQSLFHSRSLEFIVVIGDQKRTRNSAISGRCPGLRRSEQVLLLISTTAIRTSVNFSSPVSFLPR